MIDLRPPRDLPPPETTAPPPDPGSIVPGGPTLPLLSGPGWLAVTGCSLLLVASVVVVSGQWAAIGPTARFAGLVGALFAVYFAAEASRDRLPTTATSLAGLAACITAPVGIAATAALEGRWPLCITIGGGAALLACELQSRRWQLRTLKAATVVATGLLVTGLADIIDTPAAVLGAGAAVVALILGARRRSFVLAALVPFVPALWLLAESGIGPGVLERVGVVSVEDWVVPVSTLIAGLTIAVNGQISRRADIAASSLAVLAYSGVWALFETLPALSIWLSVPPAATLLVGVVALGGEHSIFSRWAGQARTPLAAMLGGASMIAPIVLIWVKWIDGPTGAPLAGELVLPSAVALAAMVFLATTVERTALLDDILRAACSAAFVAAVAATSADLVIVAAAALAAWGLTTTVTSWRSWLAITVLHATLALLAVATSDADPSVATVFIVASLGIVVVALLAWHRTELGRYAVSVPALLGCALLAPQWPSDRAALAAAIALAAIAATCLTMRRTGWNAGDTLAVALGFGAASIAVTSSAPGVSLAITLFAAQVWIYAVAFHRVTLAAWAAGLAGTGLLSLWWTTGTNDLVIDRIAPYGASGQDVALGAAALGLLAGGAGLRTVQRTSTWLAYSPGLGLTFAWLLIAQTRSDADWATFGALVIGVISIGVGGARRLASPLVFGTAGLLATGVISVGDRLAAAPTWIWIAVGGVGLLTLAAMLERSERPFLPTRTGSPLENSPHTRPGDLESLAELFTKSFE